MPRVPSIFPPRRLSWWRLPAGEWPGGASHVLCLPVAEEGALCTVVEHFLGLEDAPYLTAPVAELVLIVAFPAVALPRKKIRGLQMLSGGERALTSIALLFAMSQVNPPPFLILDETDAALDNQWMAVDYALINEATGQVFEAARVFVEYEPQTRIEGDLQQMPADFPVTELWSVLSGSPGDGVRLGRFRAGGLLRAAPGGRPGPRTGAGRTDRPAAGTGRPA